MRLRLRSLSTRSFFTLLLAVVASGFGLLAMPGSAQAQRSGGGSQVQFQNDSSRPVKLMHWDRARSKWDSHGTVNPHTSSYQSAEIGDHWAFVDPRTGQVISSLSVGRCARHLAITNENFGDHGGHDDHDDDDDDDDHGRGGRPQPAVLLEIHASNHSSQTLYLYRDGGSGALEYVETLNPRQESKLRTPPNTLWAMVSPKTNQVVSQIRITSAHNDLEVHDSDLGIGRPAPRPQPAPAPRPVSVSFVNLSAERLVIYHKENSGDGHQVATVQPRQQQRLSLATGDQYLVLRSSDHQVVHSLRVPDRSTTVTLSQQQVRSVGGGGGGRPGSGGGRGDHDHDHDHGGGGGRGHDDHDDHDHDDHGPGAGGKGNSRTIVIDPREFLRNLFGR